MLEESRSKKAFKNNIKTEMSAGKPVKQAVAIAYAERKNAITGKLFDSLKEGLLDAKAHDEGKGGS